MPTVISISYLPALPFSGPQSTGRSGAGHIVLAIKKAPAGPYICLRALRLAQGREQSAGLGSEEDPGIQVETGQGGVDALIQTLDVQIVWIQFHGPLTPAAFNTGTGQQRDADIKPGTG